eukprot:81233-Pyramimonas_sp.AAC.1
MTGCPLDGAANRQGGGALPQVAEPPVRLLCASPAPAIKGATGDQTIGERKEPLPMTAGIAARPSKA